MSKFDKRLEQLERRLGISRAVYFVALPVDNDLWTLQETGKDSDGMLMDEPSLDAWAQEQPDNVTLLKVVYPEETGLVKLTP